jgi:tetrapyrrole methylase family protein/MazG family protein
MREFDRLTAIMTRLRGEGGCPWDREQTHRSIQPYVIEEAYEVAEAIDHDDPRELCAELGDLLLQVVFHAEMAREAGRFDIGDVCRAIVAKLVRRHPHVFADVVVRDATEVTQNWEAIKAAERGPASSAIDGVPRALPALQRASRIGEKAARVGFDWTSPVAVLEKLDEERGELGAAIEGGDPRAVADELGDLLLASANLARKLGVEPEAALRAAVDRFDARFRYMEAAMRAAGEEMREATPAALDRRWEEAKRALATDLTGPEPIANKTRFDRGA